jgi:hypothetical protein
MTATRNFLHYIAILSTAILVVSGCDDPSSKTAKPESSATTESAAPAAASVATGPKLNLKNPVVAFGDIYDYEKRTAEVNFSNSGGSQLTINQVQPTCGCTTTKLDKTTFQPNEEYMFTLNFSPKGSGKQSKIVKIHSNDPDSPITNLTITANVITTVKATPRTFSIGKIPYRKAYTTSAILTSDDPGYNPTSVSITGQLKPHVTGRLTEITPEGSTTRSWRVDIDVAPNLPWGWHTGNTMIRGTVKNEDRVYPHQYNMGMNVSAEGKITANDTMIRLMTIKPGSKISRRITLSSKDRSPFEIKNTFIQGGNADTFQVTATPANPEQSEWELVFSGTAPRTSGVVKGNVLVQTNIPGEEAIAIKYSGNVRP